MGVLPEGIPLSWQETKALSKHVQKHGVQQFINLYHRSKDRKGDPFKWGDEFEYIIVKFDDEKKEAKVACKSPELLNILNKKEKLKLSKGIWSPEFGAYQLESSPVKPFEGSFEHFKTVEQDMRMRRKEVQDLLADNECILTLVNSLRFGCKDFTYPSYEVRPYDNNCYAKSFYIPDEVIYAGHPRYLVITRNIQMRRGERAQSKLKVFKDQNTKLPIENSPLKEPDVIMFDNTFGCNLQVTFQGADMAETRYLYDQLAPLCPIIQAVTAASPIFRGYLTEIDNSYHFLGDGSDDRTAEERGVKPLKGAKCRRLAKKRWDSIDSYLTAEAEMYNDIELYYEQELYDHMRQEGVDHVMAQHVAHIFMRDSLLIVNGKINQNDEHDTGHFDNINTTTWQTLRFKPALPNTDLCWRVEFRPCDIQITDFENAAVSCFVILLTRAILHYRLNFLMPISKIDENMQTAQKRDACRREKFYFRNNIMKSQTQLIGGGKRCANGYSNGHINGTNSAEYKGKYHNGNSETNGNHNGQNGHNNDHYKNESNENNGQHNDRYQNRNIDTNENHNGKKQNGKSDETNGNHNDQYQNGNSENNAHYQNRNSETNCLHNDHYQNGNSETNEKHIGHNQNSNSDETNGNPNGQKQNGNSDETNGNHKDQYQNGNSETNGNHNGQNQNGNCKSNGNHKDDYIECNGVAKDFNKTGPGKEFDLMTIDEIFNGRSNNCPGLIPLIRNYLDTLDLDNETCSIIDKYLILIEKRASGEIPTNAMWLRQQVLKNPEYKNDSLVTERINYDILKKIQEIQEAETFEFNLFL